MSAIPGRFWRNPLVIALIGFAAMYLPIYWWAATTIWQTDEQAQGALILMVVLWLFWEQREAVIKVDPQPVPAIGWTCLILGSMIYELGRLANVSILEFGSQIPVLLGAILILLGWPGVRAAWFPLLYMVFMVPLPAVFVDAVTGPLKQWISEIAESVLYAFGYPIARHGVTLAIGQYELLVADACAGLHSMFSLSALGLLFLHLKGRRSLLHNALMLASILPIAFAANVMRVIILVLITYHLGDEAGQGFLHGTAGIVMILAAVGFLFVLDAVLAWFILPGANQRRMGGLLDRAL